MKRSGKKDPAPPKGYRIVHVPGRAGPGVKKEGDLFFSKFNNNGWLPVSIFGDIFFESYYYARPVPRRSTGAKGKGRRER